MLRFRRRRGRFVLALVAISAGAVLYLLRPSDDASRDGSEPADVTVDIGEESPSAYRITYAVETITDSGTTRVTDDVIVRRPFDARVVTTSSTGRVETISTFGIYGPRRQALHIEPGTPEPDRHSAAVLEEAVDDGYAERRETRRVAGRGCRVYRLGAEAGSTSLPKLVEGADSYTDVCVDRAGLILEEVAVTDREMGLRKLARRVDLSPRIARGTFDIDPPERDPRRLGSVQELIDDSRLPGGTFWQPAGGLDGLRFRGRYAVIPAAQTGFEDITARGSVITFLSEVWADATNVVVIDQGATQGSRPFDRDPNARRVSVGELGEGELRYSLRASEVRVATSEVRFVRVRGTLAPSRLLGIARSLEGVEGGPLRTARP